MALDVTVFNTEMGWMGIAGTSAGICKVTLPMPNKASAFIAITDEESYDHGIVHRRISRNSYSRTFAKLMEDDTESPEENGLLSDVKDAMIKYFKGQRVDFSFPLDLKGYTKFQKDVWKATRSIPYGELRSYGWVASQIGKPKSARAVGQALGANPIPIIIPCHRVVASDGSLHGFTGGLELKQRLIELEKGI
jgi:methylated-DNA-[protein]-cysteine S-methyltransferase